MTPERAAGLVTWWVGLYTRGLPDPIAQRRVDEIEADLHDHVAHERSRGTSDQRIALDLLSRMFRGLPADASWRRQTIARHSTSKRGKNMSKTRYRPDPRIAIAVAFVVALPLLTMLFTNEVRWGVFDFVLAAVLVAGAGVLVDLAVRRTSNVGYLIAATALGIAAMALGEADDAPGLVLFGCLLVAAAIALGVRRAQRST